jgi:hypothetical protein
MIGALSASFNIPRAADLARSMSAEPMELGHGNDVAGLERGHELSHRDPPSDGLLSRPLAGERPRTKTAAHENGSWLAAMTEHKFKIGQLVYFQPGSRAHARPGPYQIVRRLPESEGEFHYVISSTYEDHERVARESELTRA